jgi:hypothetical protein
MEPVALFILENSHYKGRLSDCYDEKRNALTYAGTNPVIAHPPCQLWGRMAIINYKRWGGEHNKPGNDGGCFKFALDTVNRCGGVLEHPAGSYAWNEYGLVKPIKGQWTKSGDGWTCEVWQSAYGHKANKKTWLYFKGKEKPIDPKWETPKGTHQIGFQDQRGKDKNKPTLGKFEANSTPIEFMEYLIHIATVHT